MSLEQLLANLHRLADDIQRGADDESFAASQGLYGESAGIRRAAKLIELELAKEPKAYRWKSTGHIWRIVAPSRTPGSVIAERDDGHVASYAESVFRDPNVVEPLD